jgi:hypothetical protein
MSEQWAQAVPIIGLALTVGASLVQLGKMAGVLERLNTRVGELEKTRDKFGARLGSVETRTAVLEDRNPRRVTSTWPTEEGSNG